MRPPPVIRKKNPSRVLNITIGVVATLFVGTFYFFMFDGYNMIKPKHPEKEFVKGVVEKVVDAKTIRVKGTILVANRHEVTAINVVSGKQRKIFSTKDDVLALSGPNQNGFAVAVIGERYNRFRLVILNLKTRSFEELPQTVRAGVFGENPADARVSVPNGENAVYFVSGIQYHQLQDPEEYRIEGPLSRLDLVTKETKILVENVFCSNLSASADGNTIWYCAAIERRIAQSFIGPITYSNGKGSVAGVVRLKDGVSTPLYSGNESLLVSEGKQLLLSTPTKRVIVDLNLNKVVSQPWPEYVTEVMHLEGDLLIGTAKQIRLEDVKYDDLGPSMGGPQAMDRVIAMNLKSKQVHVILPHIESYAQWSYGDFDTSW